MDKVKSYPNADDPKNLDYVLWTHGLNKNMNLDSAIAAMTHDSDAGRLVRGATREQLKSRFGYLREFEEATEYLKVCPSGDWGVKGKQGKDVVFLRDGPYMVVMQNGHGTDLVLCKGY
jgi:hypothetical protein